MAISQYTPVTANISSETKITTSVGQTKVTANVTNGARGYSAYDVWLLDGHEGSITDFLAWLKSDSYKHTQSQALTSWTINHNLNKFPSVTVIDSANRVVYGDVEYLDSNTLIVSFNAAFSGKAYLN